MAECVQVLNANARLQEASRLREEANRRRQVKSLAAGADGVAVASSYSSSGLGQPLLDGE